jgi:hypothetical protein
MFFAVAIVATLCGVQPYPCAVRAVTAAAATYVLMTVLGRVGMGIVESASRDQSAPVDQETEADSEVQST